jgi:DNA invertase Pin-like site-specific DNA recombinase
MREMVQRGRNRGGYRIRGSATHNAKLTEARVIEIRQLYDNSDLEQSELAREYGVANSTISSIVNRKTWAHAEEFVKAREDHNR